MPQAVVLEAMQLGRQFDRHIVRLAVDRMYEGSLLWSSYIFPGLCVGDMLLLFEGSISRLLESIKEAHSYGGERQGWK